MQGGTGQGGGDIMAALQGLLSRGGAPTGGGTAGIGAQPQITPGVAQPAGGDLQMKTMFSGAPGAFAAKSLSPQDQFRNNAIASVGASSMPGLMGQRPVGGGNYAMNALAQFLARPKPGINGNFNPNPTSRPLAPQPFQPITPGAAPGGNPTGRPTSPFTPPPGTPVTPTPTGYTPPPTGNPVERGPGPLIPPTPAPGTDNPIARGGGVFGQPTTDTQTKVMDAGPLVPSSITQQPDATNFGPGGFNWGAPHPPGLLAATTAIGLGGPNGPSGPASDPRMMWNPASKQWQFGAEDVLKNGGFGTGMNGDQLKAQLSSMSPSQYAQMSPEMQRAAQELVFYSGRPQWMPAWSPN